MESASEECQEMRATIGKREGGIWREGATNVEQSPSQMLVAIFGQ